MDDVGAGVEIDVGAAVERLRGHVRRTPVVSVDAGTFGLAYDLVMKLENLQHAGSFKARGSFNAALAHGLGPDGLIAASGGNHGIAVAHVGRALGVPAEIFVPSVSSPIKIERIRARGATVHVTGDRYADAQQACDARAAETEAFNIHPFDAPHTVAGQATVGVELWEQAGPFDTVVAAVGGGGLTAGLATALPSSVRVVCVEPPTSRCLGAALEAGEPVDVEVGGVAADSLGARRIGSLPWSVLRERATHVEVDDDAIVSARTAMWVELGLAVETGASAALAALMAGVYQPEPGERVAVVVCGSNTDPSDLGPATH